MVTYYCVKSTKEIIGKHKDWLALRDANPTRYEELRAGRPNNLELVSIGVGVASKWSIIKEYGLWEEHVKLRKAAMQHELEGYIKEAEEIKADIKGLTFNSTIDLLQDRLDKLESYIEDCQRAIKRGDLSLPSWNDDIF